MGAADVVPGVSGGTIAFITGIYDTLVESIRRIDLKLFPILKKEGIRGVLTHVNAPFLITLFAGILTSIVSLARLVTWALEHHPIPLWSFFFGLIVISVIHMLKQVTKHSTASVLLMFCGVFFAWSITVMHPIALSATGISIVFGGAIAICAMILPGISGSFILLLLGLYSPVLGAIKEFDITIISLFAVGAIAGLLSFSHLLSYLLHKHRNSTLSFLIGLMVGTLGKIWPWKEVISWRVNSKGKEVPLLENNLLPNAYEQITGNSAQLFIAIACFVLGLAVVYLLEKTSKQ